MKYFNIKRYKFSTVRRQLSGLLNNIFNISKLINFKKIYNYFVAITNFFKKRFKYLDLRNYNILNIIKKIKIKRNKFLFFHLPAFIILFGLLYVIIPIFYIYDKTSIQKIICGDNNLECIVKGKLSYNFFPTPRLKITDLIINISSNNINLLTAKDVSLKLSIKNLLVKEKHKIKKIIINNFESNINLKKLKYYNNLFEKKMSSYPVIFKKGSVVLYDNKKYIAEIHDVNMVLKLLKDSSEAKLKGIFLDDNLTINFNNEIKDNKPITKIEIKMKNLNFYTKVNFLKLNKIIKNGKFLIRFDKNNISGIFDYKDDEFKIIKSNIRNSFIDGKLLGKIIFLPYFDFDLDLNLNSINFTRLYNHFLFLNVEEQKKLFKINNKINGKINFSAEKVYSKNNLVRSFESRIKFYNGNLKIEQFLIDLGKLGAADLLGRIDNDKESSNFKFESNIFVDNNKKFLSKFGIYNKDKLSSNLFVKGNFDLENVRLNLYEISSEENFNTDDINFIESEFNDLILENGFENLFNFQKFKVFLKSARDEKD